MLRDAIASARRVELAHLPTPLEPMERLSAYLGGPKLLAKRDDLTGLGLGGNKVRKLEFVVPDALAHDADVLVTAGVAQSNSVRQIAAAATKVGLDCHVIDLTDRVPATAPRGITGNAFLIRLFGATVHQVPWSGDRAEAIEAAAAELSARGRRPYIVPYGVSNPLGAMGYVAAAIELSDQLDERGIDAAAVVHASGSGGTQAGLAVGFAGTGMTVIGIDADAEPDRVHKDVAGIAATLAVDLGVDAAGVVDSIEVAGGHAGEAYASITDQVIEAIDLGARLEGLVLDPVYSGKGLAGLIALIRAGRFAPSDTVVFIHTGGAPGLLAVPDILDRFDR